MASKKTVLPCRQAVPCRIEVRVTRTDRSAKKGRTGKQLEGLNLRLKDIDTGTIVATATSKGGSSAVVFEKGINCAHRFTVEAELPVDSEFCFTGTDVSKFKTSTLVGPFGPTESVGSVFKSNRRVARVEIEVDRVKPRIYYRLRIRLATKQELGTHFFKDAATTPAGQKERLQILGFYNRPLDYDFSIRQSFYRGILGEFTASGQNTITNQVINTYTEAKCLETAARYYRRWFKLGVNADISATLDQHVLEFLVQSSSSSKGLLPADGEFGKVRLPGGYNVFWPKGSREEQAGLFGSGGTNRYDVEQAFYTANPLLGRVPIVAEVDRKEGGGPWELLGNVDDEDYEEVQVAFRLVPPGKVPAKHYAAATPARKGTLPKLDEKSGKVIQKAQSGDSGPEYYLQQRVATYAPAGGDDPQMGNVHWHLGAKRGISTTGDLTQTGGGVRPPLFPTGATTHPAAYLPPVAGVGDAYKHCVFTKAQRDGRAFVMLSPSRISGDMYKLQAEIGPETIARDGDDAKALVKSGALVVWRNIRVLHHIRVLPPKTQPDVDPALAADLKMGTWQCDHNAHVTGRICLKCLKRESLDSGELDWVDFTAMGKTEFSKAFCELEVDPSIAGGTFEDMSDQVMKDALTAALAIVQGDKEVNSFDNAAEPALPFALADGATSNFGVRKIAKSFQDGSVQVVLRSPSASGEISWKLLALHNSATGTLGDPPPIDPAGSSYNRTTNRLDLTFTAALDPAWVIKVDTVDAASGNAVKINIDPANIAPNGLSLSQVMTAPLLSGFKVSIAGTEVGGDQSKVYSKADVYLGPVAGATGPLAGTTGSVTEGKPNVMSLKLLAPLTLGKEVKIYGDGDNSGAGGHANGVVVYTGKGTAADETWLDVKVTEKLALANTWLKVDAEVIAKSDGTGKLVPVPTASIKIHAMSKVVIGAPVMLKLKFPTALTGTEAFELTGGGVSPVDTHLDSFLFTGQAGKTTMELPLPKGVKRYETELKCNAALLADDQIRVIGTPTAGTYTLTRGVVDCPNGTIELVFAAPLPAGTAIGVNFVCPEDYFELNRLFYFPTAGKKSPFLFHLHTPWKYNEIKSPAYGPLPVLAVYRENIPAAATVAQDIQLGHFGRIGSIRIAINGEVWARSGSGSSGGPAMTRACKGLAAEFDVSVPGGKTVSLKQKAVFPGGTTLAVTYPATDAPCYKNVDWGTLPDDSLQHITPTMVIQKTGKILPRVLTEFFRQIHGNQGFIPGLIFAQASLYDSLSCTYAGGAQVGLAQGPGSFLTGTRMFAHPDSYPFNGESEDGVQTGNAQVIGVHEISHSLFFQHAVPAGGAYPEDHDGTDICLMSYNNEMFDFCGQCLASLRGMNAKDGRLTTANHAGTAIPYQGSDHWSTQAVTS